MRFGILCALVLMAGVSLAEVQVIGDKKYECTIYSDGKNADYEKNPKSYTIKKRMVKKGDVIKIKEARGGGFAMSLFAKK